MNRRSKKSSGTPISKPINRLDRIVYWWMTPLPVDRIRSPRAILGLLAAAYFGDAMTDASFWYGTHGLHSNSQVAGFLEQSGLADVVAASLSPLFLVDSIGVYYAVCVLGLIGSLAMAIGAGGRILAFAVWLAIVAWANRLLWLSDLTESFLSLSLFSTALAPSSGLIWKTNVNSEPSEFTGFSTRLFAVQGTLFAIFTMASMLASSVWWNGTGAIALAAPVSIRTLDLTPWLNVPIIHDVLTHGIILAVPLGVLLAWRRATRKIGCVILVGWALVLGLLGSHWIYGATLATSLGAIAMCHPGQRVQ